MNAWKQDGCGQQLELMDICFLPFFLSSCVSQHQNQLILGVMGIDVSLDDIKKLTPRFTVSLTLISHFSSVVE